MGFTMSYQTPPIHPFDSRIESGTNEFPNVALMHWWTLDMTSDVAYVNYTVYGIWCNLVYGIIHCYRFHFLPTKVN